MKIETRNELEIFKDLEELCTSPGYAHVIAYFCYRDNTIRYVGEISVEDRLQQFSGNRLIRSEISTLIGLMYKKEIILSIPEPDIFQKYIDQTESLLEEIHNAMRMTIVDMSVENNLSNDFNPLKDGSALREAIFYSDESAYDFQYLELSIRKYSKDNDWFIRNKGYSIEQAGNVISTISKLQNNKINDVFNELINKDIKEWSMLPAFIFNVDDILSVSDIDINIIESVIKSFIPPAGMKNKEFSAIDDFNLTNAYPILPLKDSSYLLFQYYSLVEALYETPFFWFIKDASYKDIAMKHRGNFTEEFSAERLKLVFGNNRVFTNINICDSKKKKVGEIDVLVVFANRAIILQAKSKKLTITARKGNNKSLQNDFQAAIQEAYDQAFSCAGFLGESKYKLCDSESNELKISRSFKEIYLFCVVSDHYPSLSFQSRQFLNYTKTDVTMSPFVIDVFAIDVITEMLQTPLYFLSYINRRTEYIDKVHANHELTVLSYHLKQNLWLNTEHEKMLLGDDISIDIDIAMSARRKNTPGFTTPEGILTKYTNTAIGKLIQEIELLEQPRTIDLGFMLLLLDENTMKKISINIEKIAELARQDGKDHNLTVTTEKGHAGLIIHCNNDPIFISKRNLQNHCDRRKYAERTNIWFGICLDPESLRIRFGLTLEHKWELSEEMEEVLKDILKPQPNINLGTRFRNRKKIGRNEPCPCGSGKKYKKCCITS